MSIFDDYAPYNLHLMATFSVNVCPLCCKAESKGVEVRLVDESAACVTFMQETGVCVLSQTINSHFFMNNLSLTILYVQIL